MGEIEKENYCVDNQILHSDKDNQMSHQSVKPLPRYGDFSIFPRWTAAILEKSKNHHISATV